MIQDGAESLTAEIGKILGKNLESNSSNFWGFYIKNGTSYEATGKIGYRTVNYNEFVSVELSFAYFSGSGWKIKEGSLKLSNSSSVPRIQYTMKNGG
jgi:hypothetical protein